MAEWGTVETAGLSERMTLRVLTQIDENLKPGKRDRIPIPDIVLAAIGVSSFSRPSWFPRKVALQGYDDSWEDWTIEEIATLRDRLQKGIKPELIYTVFKPHEGVVENLNLAVFGRKKTGQITQDDKDDLKLHLAEEPEGFDIGEFTVLDIEDDEDRRFANRRWDEYAERVDINKPQNQTLIRFLVIIEVQLRNAIQDLSKPDPKERNITVKLLQNLREQFSKAANDMALLEKQNEPEQDDLQDVIDRTHDIRLNWRDTRIENEMGLHNLFDLHEKMHKTNVGDDEDEIDIPKVKPRKPRKDVKAAVALSAVKALDADNEGMVFESD